MFGLLDTNKQLSKRTFVAAIFISADEPLDVRRKQTFERMRYRAEREGKTVSVTDGVLYIEGVTKYSVLQGSLELVQSGL